MKKGSRGIIESVLSGVALIGMMLSVCVSQGQCATDVYNVPARFMTHTAGQYSNLTQYFRMTCDSVLSVSFYNGWYPGQGTFWAELRDSASGTLAWNGSRNTADSLKYKDIGFTVNTVVTRGKTYKLIIGYTYGFGGYNYYLDVYYDTTNVYRYGKMYLYGDSVDLCARVRGVNRIPQDFWGINGYITSIWSSLTRDSVSNQAQRVGIKFTREQILWKQIQYSSPDSFNIARVDSGVDASLLRGFRVLINFLQTPTWASSKPDSVDTSFAYQYPPINLDSSYANGTGKNYLYNFVDSLVKRYKNRGGIGVKDWEVFNEVNYIEGWNYPDPQYYDTGRYPHNLWGRTRLYAKACSVAYDAIKANDSNAKVFTNGLLFPNGDFEVNCSNPLYPCGKEWLRSFYDNLGGRYTDVLSYHFYQSDTIHRFVPGRLIADYDTLRAVMCEKGDTLKEIWATEGGFGSAADDGGSFKWSVHSPKQADIVVQTYAVGLSELTDALGPLGHMGWYNLLEESSSDTAWYKRCGLLKDWQTWGGVYKPSGWAYKQMTTKLKSLYFNRRVPIDTPTDSVYCYEFEDPGTRLKTFVVWRRDTLKPESISVRTAQYDSIAIDTNGSPRTSRWDATGTGRAKFWCDSVPRYFQEVGDTTRPDIIVDSTWIYPTNPDPRAGEGVWFYARLKNVGNASLSSSIWNSVTFQVDGVSKKTYQIQRTLNIGDTVTLGASPPGGGASDWQATWGDHLIRAWADSADRYVELREDNNTKYLWKHFQPKVSVVINNDHKYTNHLANDTVSVTINGNTSPNPDSTYFRHESGSWTKIGHVTSFDTLVTYSGNGVGYDSVLIFQGADTALAGDSIIVDADAPFVDITSPIQNQTVSGLVPFVGWSWDYQDHDSLWQIYVDGSPWVSGNSKIGENPMMGLPDTFGTWDSRTVANGWRWHQLRSTDAATNLAKDSVKVKVSNHQTNNGDSWASDFGTYSSPVMNVATDPGGNFYIAETQNSKVRKYSPRKDSLFAFSVKRGNDSTGTTWATAIVLKDSSTIWIADGYAHCIKKFDRQGNLLLRFGSFGSDTSRFKQPCGIALDKKGRLWVSDRLNNRIQVFDSTGHYLFQFGTQGQDSGKFNSPTGITITPNGLVWVSDTRNNQIQVFDSLGQYLKTIKAVDSLGLDTPLGICSDKWGDVFIADAHHNRIVELNPYGERILDFGGLGDSLWQFRTPIGVASSPGAHYLYVADMGNRRVQRFWVIQDDTLGGGGPQSKDAVRLPPKVTYLSQSYPNPATGKAVIEYGLAKENDVRLVIYNVAGQVVRDYNQGKQKAWYYSITWDGRSNRGHKIGAGIYFYRLEAGTWVKTRKMVVIR